VAWLGQRLGLELPSRRLHLLILFLLEPELAADRDGQVRFQLLLLCARFDQVLIWG
jgi:hypothetical protein